MKLPPHFPISPFTFFIVVFALSLQTSAQAQIYVDVDTPAPPGLQTGNGWATAYATLQQGIDASASLSGTAIKEIWVADGTYYPSEFRDPTGQDRASISFSLLSNTRLYGGFRGAEGTFPGESSISERKAILFTRTVLDGNVSGLRVRHVVFCEPAATDNDDIIAQVDGFRIVNGRAAGPRVEDNRGGGIYARETSLIVKNCEFQHNQAAKDGGAIYWWRDWDYLQCPWPTTSHLGLGIAKSRFLSNQAVSRGGAVYAHLPEKIMLPVTLTNGVPTSGIPSHIQNCEFTNNEAGLNFDPAAVANQGGGAVAFFNAADFLINGNTFFKNTVHGKGSAVYMAYEWYGPPPPCDPGPVRPHPLTFRNNNIVSNSSLPHNQSGGPPATPFTAAVYSEPRPGNAHSQMVTPDHDFTNSIVRGNTNVSASGLMSIDQMGPMSHYDVASSNIEFWSQPYVWPIPAGTNAPANINANPMFEDPIFGDFRLKNGSPCINTGSDWSTAGDAGDVNDDNIYALNLGLDLPFAPDRTSLFFKNPGLGIARIQPLPTGGNYPIDMGALERE